MSDCISVSQETYGQGVAQAVSDINTFDYIQSLHFLQIIIGVYV